MELYVVRHGKAEPQGQGSDRERALTERGAKAVAAVGRGLASLGVVLDGLFVSPLRRAQETARIFARSLGEPALETQALLDGSAPAASILQELAEWSRARRRVAIVGHQPVLGELITLASFGAGRASVALPTAGVARIDFAGSPRIAAGELIWLAPPDLLGRVDG